MSHVTNSRSVGLVHGLIGSVANRDGAPVFGWWWSPAGFLQGYRVSRYPCPLVDDDYYLSRPMESRIVTPSSDWARWWWWCFCSDLIRQIVGSACRHSPLSLMMVILRLWLSPWIRVSALSAWSDSRLPQRLQICCRASKISCGASAEKCGYASRVKLCKLSQRVCTRNNIVVPLYMLRAPRLIYLIKLCRSYFHSGIQK